MNQSAIDRPSMHVEGKDDLNSIIHLMRTHGVDYDPKPWPAAFPQLKAIDSIEKLLEGMIPAISASGGNTIGFVLDADSPIQQRWEAVKERLVTVGVTAPPHVPSEGFIGYSNKIKTRVGVWLMPDNVNDGSLEDFLRELIGSDDLIELATHSTDQAKGSGAAFREVDRTKAIVHTWLAWQAEPGLPYGTAIRAKYFQAELPAGQHFASWFRELYEIQ